jgi:gliding motility-associated-like protein
MKRKLLSFFLLLTFFNCTLAIAQSTSNKGTDFWIAYAGHIDALTSRMTLFLSSDVNTTYTVKVGGNIIASGNIAANIVTPVFINPNNYNVHIGSSNVVETQKGINVTSADPISVYSVISNNARTGSTLILPTVSLEKEYYVFSYQIVGTTSSAAYSEFTIVGVENGTQIEITPTKTDRNNTRTAGVPFQITLNKGDIYQYQSGGDLSGTHLKTVNGCSPFAVFSGNNWASFCENGNPRNPSGGDNIYQQLFPVTSWGRNFVSSPFYNTINGNTDIIRLIVAEDNTTITVNGSTTNANGTILANPYSKGSVVTFFSNTASIIKADKPISVAQYQTSQTCNLNNSPDPFNGNIPYPGDPEMTILNPIEQTLKDITVYSKLNSVPGVNTNIQRYYLNVIIKTADVSGFTIDGNSISNQFVKINNSDYSYAIIDVTNSQPQHRLKASGGFTAIAYGYGSVESYAYLAGTDIKNLKSIIELYKSGNVTPSTNFCLGNSFSVTLQLPYVTNKIIWNLNNGLKTDIVTSPSYTTKVINGDLFYIYNYSIPAGDITTAGNYLLKASVEKPATSACAKDEDVITSFDVYAPDFTLPAQACLNNDVDFSEISVISGINITSRLWDFGDGNQSNAFNPKHRYTTSGIKTVTLTVVTDFGCTLSATKQINILPTPVAKFSTTAPLCTNSLITFKNESTSNTNITAYEWDFGDGKTSNLQSPTHLYTNAGNFTVVLNVTSQGGCINTFTKTITINEKPEISFKDPGSCVDDLVKFNADILSGDIISWKWDFGDGSSDVNQNTKQNPQHKYTQAGLYNVKVTGISINGCSTDFTMPITISGSNPVVALDVKDSNRLCAANEVVFQNKSTVAFGKITKIEWIYDYVAGANNVIETDNNPSPNKIYTHKYPDAATDKTYQVVMIAYSGQICYQQSQPINITVHPSPKLKFDQIARVCENSGSFQLIATELTGISGNYIFSGNGVTSTGIFNPRLVGVGTHKIKCLFISDNSCIEEKEINIVVSPSPLVNVGQTIDILKTGKQQISAKASGNNLKFKWKPSEGLDHDDVLNPIASPVKTTLYTLTVTSDNNCETTESILVNVIENPEIPNTFTPNGDGKNDTWDIKYLESVNYGSVSVFNRYGQKLFSSTKYTTPWDGRFNGKNVPDGVYYYIIEINNKKRYTGALFILR